MFDLRFFNKIVLTVSGSKSVSKFCWIRILSDLNIRILSDTNPDPQHWKQQVDSVPAVTNYCYKETTECVAYYSPRPLPGHCRPELVLAHFPAHKKVYCT
jgi:hypothetical protein